MLRVHALIFEIVIIGLTLRRAPAGWHFNLGAVRTSTPLTAIFFRDGTCTSYCSRKTSISLIIRNIILFVRANCIVIVVITIADDYCNAVQCGGGGDDIEPYRYGRLLELGMSFCYRQMC